MEEVSYCRWNRATDLDRAYHDTEWGVPVHDDRKQFEYLLMEAMQCGLSWGLMLRKRATFRACFDEFDFEKVARIKATENQPTTRPAVGTECRPYQSATKPRTRTERLRAFPIDRMRVEGYNKNASFENGIGRSVMKKFSTFGAVVCGLVASVFAAGGTWQNSAGGTWSETTNWQNGTVPSGQTESDYGVFPAFTGVENVAITLDKTTDINGIQFDTTPYTITGGHFNFYSSSSDDKKRGIYVKANGHVTVGSSFYVARSTPIGLEAGAVLRTTGRITSANGQWLVKKGQGLWQIGGEVVDNMYYFCVTEGTIEFLPGSSLVDGADSSGGYGVEIARAGYDGTLIFRKGARVNINDHKPIQLGLSGNKTGTLEVDGATVERAKLTAAHVANSVGVVKIHNGANVWLTNFDFAYNGRAEADVYGGAKVYVNQLRVGLHDKATASSFTISNAMFTVQKHVDFKAWKSSDTPDDLTFTLADDGVLCIPVADEPTVDVGRNVLKFAGGTVKFTDGALIGGVIDDYLPGIDEIQLTEKGGTIDYGNPSRVFVTTPVAGAGALAKTGAGEVFLTQDVAGVTALKLKEGTLGLTGNTTVPLVRYLHTGKLSLESGMANTVTINDLEALENNVPLTIALDLTASAQDKVVFGAQARLSNQSLVFTTANPRVCTDVEIASWQGADAPQSVAFAVSAGFRATVNVDASVKKIKVSISHDTTSSSSVWINPDGGSWSAAANWTGLPGVGSMVEFGSYLTAPTTAVAVPDAVAVYNMNFSQPNQLTLSGEPITLRGALTSASRTSIQNDLAVRDVKVNGGRLELASVSGVRSFALNQGQLAFTGSGETVLPNAALTVPAGDMGVAVDVANRVVLSGSVDVNTPLVKLGAGELVLSTSDMRFSGDGGYMDSLEGNAGNKPLSFNPITLSPVTGFRGLTVLNGKVVLESPASNEVKIYGAMIAGGSSTTEAGQETAGHIEFRRGKFTSGEWIVVGRGNGTAVTAPDGLESTLTLGEDMTRVSCVGISIGAQFSATDATTSKAKLIVNGGTLHSSKELVFGNGGVGNGLADPQLIVNGGAVQVSGELQLSLASGWKSSVFLNGGELVVRGNVKSHEGSTGVIHLNGGKLQLKSNTTFNGTTQQLRLDDDGGKIVVDLEDGNNRTLTLTADLAPEGSTGSLTKTGAGVLEIRANQSFTGDLVIEGGSVPVFNGVTLAGAVRLTSGGVFGVGDATPGSTVTIGGLIGNSISTVSLDAQLGDDGEVVSEKIVVIGDIVGAISLRINPQGGKTLNDFVGKEFTVVEYTGETPPDVSGWSVQSAPLSTFTAADGKVKVKIAAVQSAYSTWQTDGDGNWADAANWDAEPGNPATVAFTSTLTRDIKITLPTEGVTLNVLKSSGTDKVVTFEGGPVTLGAGSLLDVEKNGITMPSKTILAGDALASFGKLWNDAVFVRFNEVEGQGTYRQRSGVLYLDAENYANRFELENVTIKPETNTEVENLVTHNALIKWGDTVLMLGEASRLNNAVKVEYGTLRTPVLPTAKLTMRNGTFDYVGPNATLAKFIMDSGSQKSYQCSTLGVKAGTTLTVEGLVENKTWQAFMKTGAGTLVFAGTEADNVLASNMGAGESKKPIFEHMNNGSTPSKGTRAVNLVNGTTIFNGSAESAYDWHNTLAVGMWTTTKAGEETAATLIVRSGRLFGQQLALGRANGNVTTAPTPLQSKIRIEGGEMEQTGPESSGGMFVAAPDDTGDCTAHPKLEVVGGRFIAQGCLMGPESKSAAFTADLSGGTTIFGGDVYLTRTAGAQTTVNITGTADVHFCTNYGKVWMCDVAAAGSDTARARAEINLNGGTLHASAFDAKSAGDGVLNFNGGTLVVAASGVLLPANDHITANALAGGALVQVEAGVESEIVDAIDGTGAFTKRGAGTLIFGGSQTYTGVTTVEAGALVLRGALAGGLVVKNGATLVIDIDNQESINGKLVFEEGSKLAVTGSPANLKLGTYALLNATEVEGLDKVTVVETSLAQGACTFSDGAIYMNVTSVKGDYTWTKNAPGAWSETSAWQNGIAPGAAGVGENVTFSSALTSPVTVTMDTAATVGTLTLASSANSTFTGSAALTLAAQADEQARLTVSEATVNDVRSPIVLASETAVAVPADATLSLTGCVSGDGKIVKSGGGTLKLSGANVFSGGVDLRDAAVLELSGTAPTGTGTLSYTDDAVSTLRVPENESATVVSPIVMSKAHNTMTVTVPTADTSLTFAGGLDQYSGGADDANYRQFAKVGAGELVVSGDWTRHESAKSKLLMCGGTFRVTDAAWVEIVRSNDRASIDFNFNNLGSFAKGGPRKVIVEDRAHLAVGGIFLGGLDGHEDAIEVRDGGVLDIVGHESAGNPEDGFVIGNNQYKVDVRVRSGGGLYMTNMPNLFMSVGAYQSKSSVTVDGGMVHVSGLSLGMNEMDTGRNHAGAAITVVNGTFTVSNKMNWMGENSAQRVNTFTVGAGGAFNVCASWRSAGGDGKSYLKLDGGTLRYLPGGAYESKENRSGWLTGLEFLTLGDGESAIDTQEHAVEIAQTITADGTGGFAKLGTGTLTLGRNPQVRGTVKVTDGALALAEEVAEPSLGELGLKVIVGEDGTLVNTVAQTYQTLGGEGVVRGNATVAGTLTPGLRDDSRAGATLSAENLTLAAGATYRCSVAFNADGSVKASDNFDVGSLTLAGGGTIDLGLADGALPLQPVTKRIVLGRFGTIAGVEHATSWKVSNAGIRVSAPEFKIEENTLILEFKTSQGTVLFLR